MRTVDIIYADALKQLRAGKTAQFNVSSEEWKELLAYWRASNESPMVPAFIVGIPIFILES